MGVPIVRWILTLPWEEDVATSGSHRRRPDRDLLIKTKVVPRVPISGKQVSSQ